MVYTSGIDFYADDEDPTQPKTFINSFLDASYQLEAVLIGMLSLFFVILQTLSSESENLPVGLAASSGKFKKH